MAITDQILAITPSPTEIRVGIANRVRARRLELDYTQRGLASQAGLSLASYRRFESTGQISLTGLVMIAVVLHAEDDLAQLFATRQYRSLDDVAATNAPRRQRGHRV